MGRPPCCDKVGVKKGPWTPEEDIMLVQYVQEHGPGNWRAVPNNTGLKRCSKSCRLRWTNYLRPGIKRGTFTDNEEKMIIQLQALLGNKWAAIASYLPERTDNDIKNYWNTHLHKKLKNLETKHASNNNSSISRGQWEKRLQTDIHTAKQALRDALSVEQKSTFSDQKSTFSDQKSTFSSYASSIDNIAQLLKGWVKNTPKSEDSSSNYENALMESSCSGETLKTDEGKSGIDLSEAFESLFGFESSDDFSRSTSPTKPDPSGLGSLSVLENWLLDDQGLGNFSFDENSNLF